MRINLSRRTKIIGGIVIGIMLILSGTVFALGKAGVIDLKSLADEVVGIANQDSTDTTYHIYLRVVNDSSQPIGAGINVEVRRNGYNAQNLQTDANSIVRIENLAAGSYSIRIGNCANSEDLPAYTDNHIVNKRGTCSTYGEDPPPTCSPLCLAGYHCDNGQCVTNQQSSLFALRGAVTDGNGNAPSYIAGAQIKILDKTESSAVTTLATDTTTQLYFSEGSMYYNYQTDTFLLPNNSYNNIYLEVTATGKQPLELRLSDAGSIIGTSNSIGTTYDYVKPIAMSAMSNTIIRGKTRNALTGQGFAATVAATTFNAQRANPLALVYSNEKGEYELQVQPSAFPASSPNSMDLKIYGSHLLTYSERTSESIGYYWNPVRSVADGFLQIEPGRTYENIDILIGIPEDAACFVGHVYDNKTKAPIEKAIVALLKPKLSVFVSDYLPENAETDAGGNYQICVKVAANAQTMYSLKAFHQDYSDDGRAIIRDIVINSGEIIKSPKTDFFLNKCP